MVGPAFVRKEALVAGVEAVHAGWASLIGELGIDGLERPAVVGDWRVRDVVAHANCWDRWQLVQLRCAFTEEVPTDVELHGPITFPPNDDMREDAMNAMFLAGYAEWSTADVITHFEEVCAFRTDRLREASQEQLGTIVGADWAGGTNRIVRLASEVDVLSDPEPAWRFLGRQVNHLRAHLDEVRVALPSGRLVIPASGTPITDDDVRVLRDADQR